MTKANIYRLNYATFETTKDVHIQREIIKQMSCFTLPENISENDAFRILSYISLRIEDREGQKINTYQNTLRLNSLLKEYGFNVIEKVDVNEDKIVDLYCIEEESRDKDAEIANSPVWFNKDITSDVVCNIYANKHHKKCEIVR